MGPGLVWTGAENLAPTAIRSPDRPARSQSLCVKAEGNLNSKYFSRTSIDGELIFVSLHDRFSIR